MSRDYKYRAQPKRKRRPPIAGWKILAAGLLVITFGGFLVALSRSGSESDKTDAAGNPPAAERSVKSQTGTLESRTAGGGLAPETKSGASKPLRMPDPAHESKSAKRPRESEKPVDAARSARVEEPRWTFFATLPRKEVIIDEAEIKALRRDEKKGNPPQGAEYIVQAGSFKTLQEAEAVRAKLAKLRVRAEIQATKVEASVWYRVRIGPFGNVSATEKLRSMLRENQIDSVVQKTLTAAKKDR